MTVSFESFINPNDGERAESHWINLSRPDLKHAISVFEKLPDEQSKYLAAYLGESTPWPGLIIEAGDEKSARKIRVKTPEPADGFPVYVTYGKGNAKRFAVESYYEPEQVRKIAKLVERDRIFRDIADVCRKSANEFEDNLDDGERLAEILEFVADYIAYGSASIEVEITGYCNAYNKRRHAPESVQQLQLPSC